MALSKHKNKIFFGIIFIVVSYFSYLLPPKLLNIYNLSALLFLFITGVIFLSEGITLSLGGKSLLSEIHKNNHNVLVFVIIATFGAVLLDGVAKWLGKLWIYPYYPRNGYFFYFITFIPGFAAYWLMILESYFATKIVFDYLHKGKQIVTKSFKHESVIYKILGIFGTVIVIASLYWIYTQFSQQHISLITLEDMKNRTENFKISLLHSVFISFGVWFILEYIEFKRKKTSLIKDVIHRYLSPLFGIVIGSFICGILLESQNIPVALWSYINWPLNDVRILHTPFLIYILWPIHYIVFLSLFRAFTTQESQEIWKSDIIA